MDIAIAATFYTGYSGGRLHAYLAAVGLARQGHRVTIVCNQKPAFLNKLPKIGEHSDIQFHKVNYQSVRDTDQIKPDLWIVVQERGLNGRFFAPIFENIDKTYAPTLFLCFESPNWQVSCCKTFPTVLKIGLSATWPDQRPIF